MTLTKAIFRKKCLKVIKSNYVKNRIYINAKLNRVLIKELGNLKNKNVLIYLPLSFEADITKTIKTIRKKCNLFVPFMVSESFKMVPFRLPLEKKKFEIYEAGNSLRDIKNIDIAIVPVVGTDRNLQRVGFGKGMYDRFFAKLQKRPYTIFVQPKLCHTNKSVCDDYDIACDVLITPHVQMKIGFKNVKRNTNGWCNSHR